MELYSVPIEAKQREAGQGNLYSAETHYSSPREKHRRKIDPVSVPALKGHHISTKVAILGTCIPVVLCTLNIPSEIKTQVKPTLQMIFSTIDIGTNTILMVTASVNNDGTVQILGDEHEIARLGKGVDATRTILPETFDHVAEYLLRYRRIAESLGSERIIAFGTSALRDARNNHEFIAAMHERTGIDIELLSGEDEAALTYRGALFGLKIGAERRGVLDIGGGSTEIATGEGDHLKQSISIDIGAVRITERFFTSLPPSVEQIEAARDYARNELSRVFDLPEDTSVVGVAGTATTFGAISQQQKQFNAETLNGYRLSRQTISAISARLSRLTLEEIRGIDGVHPGRADVLPGGGIILDEFIRRYDLSELLVSTRGVRYGVMLREVERVMTTG
jgi:exopolyphosphatase/guanosine-5'-triphosphate,3'-diphosphate pyrophosphatase